MRHCAHREGCVRGSVAPAWADDGRVRSHRQIFAHIVAGHRHEGRNRDLIEGRRVSTASSLLVPVTPQHPVGRLTGDDYGVHLVQGNGQLRRSVGMHAGKREWWSARGGSDCERGRSLRLAIGQRHQAHGVGRGPAMGLTSRHSKRGKQSRRPLGIDCHGGVQQLVKVRASCRVRQCSTKKPSSHQSVRHLGVDLCV